MAPHQHDHTMAQISADQVQISKLIDGDAAKSNEVNLSVSLINLPVPPHEHKSVITLSTLCTFHQHLQVLVSQRAFDCRSIVFMYFFRKQSSFA